MNFSSGHFVTFNALRENSRAQISQNYRKFQAIKQDRRIEKVCGFTIEKFGGIKGLLSVCLWHESIRERGRDMLVMISRVVDFQDPEFSGRKQTRTIRNSANV